MIENIKNDFKESRIDRKVIILSIPVMIATYLFHEFGHWTVGELLGNDMRLSLNNSAPKSTYFIKDSHALYSAMGGPFFTILQGLSFLFIAKRTDSIIAYLCVFFAVFSRFFSIVFGGINLQDEARIASMLNVNKYLIAMLVLVILFLILWRSHRIMKMNIKALGYYTVLGVFAILVVIGLDIYIIT
ncbi:MAG: hypothetical protein MI922_00920 [Bacteroidales bacterium]|nr:hypothetical protein [Bacteroidales bacterium]